MMRAPASLQDLFARCESTTGGCIEWGQHRNHHGYGMTALNGRQWRAHRLAWAFAHGDPGDAVVMHTCDNPPCINPDHLRLGTQLENARDRDAKGRWRGRYPALDRNVSPGPEDWHGSLSGYAHHRCRCVACASRWRSYHQALRAQKREAA